MFLVQIKTPQEVALLYLSVSSLELKTPQFNCCQYLEHVQYVFRMSMWLWYLHFLLDVSVKRKWFQHHLSGLPFTSTKQHTPKLTKRYLSRPREDIEWSHRPMNDFLRNPQVSRKLTALVCDSFLHPLCLDPWIHICFLSIAPNCVIVGPYNKNSNFLITFQLIAVRFQQRLNCK